MARWIVRHGAMRFLGEFDPEGRHYARGQDVIVRTDRGHEVGHVLCESAPRAMEMLSEPTRGRIVRTMNDQDRAERARIEALEAKELETCERFAAQRRLQMEL